MRLLALLLILATLGGGGCGPSPYPEDDVASARDRAAASVDAAVPYGLDFLYAYENERTAPYYPLEGLGGVVFYDDGTLYVCDEKGGRIHGHDPRTGEWFQFDNPGNRFFRPVDLGIDQFSVLALDLDGRDLLRFDLSGVYQERLIAFNYLDPGYDRVPSAFDVDLDGGLVVTDGAENQVLTIDAYQEIKTVVGVPGEHPEQFREPSGVVILRDGSFVVADRANRRLQHFTSLGYHLAVIGGEFDPDSRLLTPQGMDVDADGNLFVADPAAGLIHVFSPELAPLFAAGLELGLEAAPTSPIDVAVGPDDLLAVSDRGRQAVLVYRIRYR